MISRILKRFSIVWLALLLAIDTFVAITVQEPPDPGFWEKQILLASPAIIGFALSWIFLPPDR